MRPLLLLPFTALAAWSSTAYDCRYFDCVTPFVSPAVPLPSGASIPQPVGWPGFPLTFTPRKATTTGFVFGQAYDGGASGPFLFDGTQTFVALSYPDFVFHDLADNGLILADEVNYAPFLTDLHGTRRAVGIAFNGLHEFHLGLSGAALSINRAGDAILMRGVNRIQMIGQVLVETDLTMIFAEPSFQPTAIPEPEAVGFMILGIAGLAAVRLRRRARAGGLASFRDLVLAVTRKMEPAAASSVACSAPVGQGLTRPIALLLLIAGSAWGTVYDCRYYDCVTPFLDPMVPLPPASSIPQPIAPVQPPLTFFPQVATVTGYVFGYASGYYGYGPFLSDGTQTRYISTWPDFIFIGLTDSGLILACEQCDSPFFTNFGGIHQAAIMEGTYRIGASGWTVAINRAGDAILARGVVHLDTFNNIAIESGLTVIFANSTFHATAIPEPGSAMLAALGLSGLAAHLWRARAQYR